jgi:hypothetical protein
MLTYEECSDLIEKEIAKRRGKWTLTILRWMDFDDVAQILRAHIFKKWHLWDQSRKLAPWIQRIMSHQICNLLRNNYTNYARPCIQCKFSLGEEGCLQTPSGEQCAECPLYKKWTESKQSGYHIKMPLELENHVQEVYNKIDDTINFKETMRRVSEELGKKMSKKRFAAFNILFIEETSDEDAIKILNIKNNTKNKYGQKKLLMAFKDSLQKEAKNIIKNSDIAEFWP